MKRLLLLLIPLALAACAAAPVDTSKEVALAPMDPDMVCEREASTGTILPKKKCRTAAEREAARQGVEAVGDSSRNIRAGQTGKPGS